jgi:hypothetical protein
MVPNLSERAHRDGEEATRVMKECDELRQRDTGGPLTDP